MYQLTEAEISTLQDRINRLSQDVREQFTRAYDRWKQTWSQPAILASSDPQVRARSKEFDDLVAMGQVIVPLLIREMSVEHDFFALQAVEQRRDQRGQEVHGCQHEPDDRGRSNALLHFAHRAERRCSGT